MSPITRRLQFAATRTSGASGGGGGGGTTAVKPDATNTGPRIALTTWSGDYHTSADNEVVSGLHITGNFWADHANVTVNDCSIDGAAYPSSNGADPVIPGLYLNYCFFSAMYATGCQGVYIDHCRIGNQCDDFLHFTRYINGNGDTLTANDIKVTNSLLDRLQSAGSNTGYHLDGIQILGANQILIQNTVIDYTAPDQATQSQITSCYTMETSYNGPASDVWTLDGCWFYGGGYYQIDPYGTNGTITNCKFDSSSGAQPMYGPPGYPYVQSGNTLDGSPVTLPT